MSEDSKSDGFWSEYMKKRQDPNYRDNAKERLKSAYSTSITDTPCIRSTFLTSRFYLINTIDNFVVNLIFFLE